MKGLFILRFNRLIGKHIAVYVGSCHCPGLSAVRTDIEELCFVLITSINRVEGGM